MPKKIAFLTAGGIAPCLSSSIGALVEQYATLAPDAELIGYLHGYQGLLLGKSIRFPESVKDNIDVLCAFGILMPYMQLLAACPGITNQPSYYHL